MLFEVATTLPLLSSSSAKITTDCVGVVSVAVTVAVPLPPVMAVPPELSVAPPVVSEAMVKRTVKPPNNAPAHGRVLLWDEILVYLGPVGGQDSLGPELVFDGYGHPGQGPGIRAGFNLLGDQLGGIQRLFAGNGDVGG